MTLVSVPCAVCGSTDFSPMFPATIDDPDADPARYFSSSRVSAGYLPIVRCRACRMVQSNPRDDDATLARVYGALADHVYESEEGNRDFDARAHLALVTGEKRPPARLLDVGCATGIFVACAVEAGFDAVGMDASRWAIERARERAPRARFEVGTLETVAFERASFDVITLWDVLEHVASPAQVLERLRGFLSPGGVLCMSMPNSESLVARAMGKRWVLLLREHLCYFSPETLARLLARTGFRLSVSRSRRVSFSLANVAGRLSQYPGPARALAARASASPLLRRACVRFPMGEMDVVARAV